MSGVLMILKCPNCDHEPFDNAFCPICGERKLTEKDFKTFSLIKDILGSLIDFEGKGWSTFIALLLHPNKYAIEYVTGIRKKYIPPIRLFLIANAFYFIFPVFNTFKTTLYIQLNQLPYTDIT